MGLLDDTQEKDSFELFLFSRQDSGFLPRVVFYTNPFIVRRNSFPEYIPFGGAKLTIEGLTLTDSPAYFRCNLVLIHP